MLMGLFVCWRAYSMFRQFSSLMQWVLKLRLLYFQVCISLNFPLGPLGSLLWNSFPVNLGYTKSLSGPSLPLSFMFFYIQFFARPSVYSSPLLRPQFQTSKAGYFPCSFPTGCFFFFFNRITYMGFFGFFSKSCQLSLAIKLLLVMEPHPALTELWRNRSSTK